jgi:hypothetical protein
MPTKKKGLFSYRRKLSQPMAELLADPFSELTRKRHTALLIAATVTLLLSFGLATVTKVDVAGAEFVLNAPQHAKWLACAVTLYLAAVYLLGVRADWAIAKAKQWSPFSSIEDVKSAMTLDKETQVRWKEEQLQKLKNLKDDRSKIKAEFQLKLDTISAQHQETAAEHEALVRGAYEERVESEGRRKSLMNELMELFRAGNAVRDELNMRLEPIDKNIQKLRVRISQNDRTVLWWNEKIDIDLTFKAFSDLTKLRLWLEILFPAGYAIFAIIWTILY